MASLKNPYTHQSKLNEQNIIQRLINESIQILGNDVIYLPRDVIIEDLVLGEDVLSKFPLAIPIEMYLQDFNGFTGDRTMFTKFGIELNNSLKWVVSKQRWEQEVKTQFDGLVANGEANFAVGQYLRPHEGDLIYHPESKFLMEIKYVDNVDSFYQLGKSYKYVLSCEAFQYANESIETGNPDIDLFNLNSRDMLTNQVLLENGDYLIFEQFGGVILDTAAAAPMLRPYGTDFNAPSADTKMSSVNPFA